MLFKQKGAKGAEAARRWRRPGWARLLFDEDEARPKGQRLLTGGKDQVGMDYFLTEGQAMCFAAVVCSRRPKGAGTRGLMLS
jgi:hypothetical protein